jgi:hypothetical protein
MFKLVFVYSCVTACNWIVECIDEFRVSLIVVKHLVRVRSVDVTEACRASRGCISRFSMTAESL